MAKARALYLVRRCFTAGTFGVGFDRNETGFLGTPVLACATAERAVQRRLELEAEARRVMAPFQDDAPEEWCTLGVKRMRARLEALGLKGLPAPSTASGSDWRRWWDEHGGELTPEQIEGVWQLLDKVQFYEVVKVRLKE
jgi:hypothetical protein